VSECERSLLSRQLDEGGIAEWLGQPLNQRQRVIQRCGSRAAAPPLAPQREEYT
jgi:hypothetical protein